MERTDINRFDNFIKSEILSRTTLTTYYALMCTNKEFSFLGNDPYTKALHKRRTSTVCGLLMERVSYDQKMVHKYAPFCGTPVIDLGFLPENSHILASSGHGLVVFESPHPTMPTLMVYHVCKPATKQYLPIPNPTTTYHRNFVSIVTMSCRPVRYKIARLSMCKSRERRGTVFWPVRMEVFDSRKWAWNILKLMDLPFGIVPVNSQPIVVSGCVYTMLSSNDILEFDAYSERLRMLQNSLSIHAHCCPTNHSLQLLKIDHKLAIACRYYYNTWKIFIRSNDGTWSHQYQVQEQARAYYYYLSFDDPSSKIGIYYNIYLFFKGNIVDNSVVTPNNLFAYESDFDEVDLTGTE